ncbi:LuxR family transcriptional regulator, partial [Streptomyces sp. NPDC091279]
MNPPLLDGIAPPPPAEAWRRLSRTLPEGVRVRLLHTVYGDPRAAAELVPLLTERQSAGLDPLPTEPAEQAPALLRAHRAQLRALPDDTRFLLLLAAADQYPFATHAFLRATAAASLDTRPLEAADHAGLAHAGPGGVVFRDAWTRVAAYEAASPADRRDAHRLLARVLNAEGERPRRSWHRGAGALGPSARLAAELGAAARQADADGRPSLARALLERAADLCPDPALQARLRARAATAAWQSGDADRARRLAATAAPDNALTGLLALRAGDATESFDALLTAATERATAAPPDNSAAHVSYADTARGVPTENDTAATAGPGRGDALMGGETEESNGDGRSVSTPGGPGGNGTPAAGPPPVGDVLPGAGGRSGSAVGGPGDGAVGAVPLRNGAPAADLPGASRAAETSDALPDGEARGAEGEGRSASVARVAGGSGGNGTPAAGPLAVR